jgi:hypothetical protein
MYIRLKTILRAFFFVSLILWLMASGYTLAKSTAKGEILEKSVSTQAPEPAKDQKDSLKTPGDKMKLRFLRE